LYQTGLSFFERERGTGLLPDSTRQKISGPGAKISPPFSEEEAGQVHAAKRPTGAGNMQVSRSKKKERYFI